MEGTSAEKRRLSSPPKVRDATDSALLLGVTLSGSSYLVPTLRIARMDTPHSISHRITTALDNSCEATSLGLVKTMIRGKLLSSGSGATRQSFWI